MSQRIELTGRKFGRLTVDSFAGSKAGVATWNCTCECGNTKVVRSPNLLRGMVQSCGCLQQEKMSERSLLHGHARSSEEQTPIYSSWARMICRCTNPHYEHFDRYGGRGITVCESWRDFRNFLADMGPTWKAGLTIDRYPNNDGNYEPGNCRWATRTQQARHRASSRMVTVFNETMCVASWAERTGLTRSAIEQRLDAGWSQERAVSVPLQGKTKCYTQT